ncbi:endolytic transglycosylase MltG [Pseudomonas sp. N040]|uniref:endolytic transglycosylase MltG n=1 Tax=Pseudomonas sp. N040 TaxID=2785325 RepID=UPI0018A2AD75|nr:endolytic transglycosylase MltG [Pseudomonas sp. N040]MBF7731356.1 endolytic transglycosylase MltG [Pseudomonas sp. N040]MBW7014999.1 endolytic transglycosylase MltG [Pseudomonas sp. N040]
MRKLLLLLEAGLLLAGLSLLLCVWLQRQALQQPLQISSEYLLDVPAGATPGGLLQQLQGEAILTDAFWLRQYWNFNLADKSLHSGEYRLLPGMSAFDLLGLWHRAEVVHYSLTLIEGWNFKQVRAELGRHTKLEQSLGQLTDEELMRALGWPGVHPEGWFFPDTYQYARGMRDSDLLKQAGERQQRVLDEEWQARAANVPYGDPYQALVMASLIEKETGAVAEREQIAGVFVRRLGKKMLLQTDPTVIYGLGERYNGNLTRADLRQPSAYNTYLNPGLPPTPIALAGREAIHAALHPAAGKSLYFVARGDGSHVFSETLDEHNRAVREYQLKRRTDYRSSPATQSNKEAQ